MSTRLRSRPLEWLTRPSLLCISPPGNLILMNAELVPSVSGDYLDLKTFSNKHSASRLGRHKPLLAASQLHQLLIGLFSPADETSITESNESKDSRGRRGGGRDGGRWEKSLDDIMF